MIVGMASVLCCLRCAGACTAGLQGYAIHHAALPAALPVCTSQLHLADWSVAHLVLQIAHLVLQILDYCAFQISSRPGPIPHDMAVGLLMGLGMARMQVCVCVSASTSVCETVCLSVVFLSKYLPASESSEGGCADMLMMVSLYHIIVM